MSNKIPLGPRTWLTWIGVGLLTLAWILPGSIRNWLASVLAKSKVDATPGIAERH